MKIGCNALYPRGILAQSSLFTVQATREALTKLAQAGYQAVEYSHAGHFNLDEAHRVREHAESIGIESWSVHAEGVGGFTLGNTAAEAQACLMHCLDVCAALGGKVVVVHAPFGIGLKLPDAGAVQETADRDRRVLAPAGARALDLGIEVALENGGELVHMEYILRLCDLLDMPSVGICVDTGHAHLGDLGAPRAVRMAGERLYTTHLQDNLGQRDDHMPPGQGTIDWPALFAALAQVGYSRTLMLELTDRAEHRPYDQDLELEQGARNMGRFAARYLALFGQDEAPS